ncbi:hypothetical protein SALBM311S_01795 [Streptomyces alboniger]
MVGGLTARISRVDFQPNRRQRNRFEHAPYTPLPPSGERTARETVVRPPGRSAARGDVGGGVPQPTGSSTAGRPTHGPCNRSPDGRRRAHGRAHGHTAGARRNPPSLNRTSVRTTIPPTGTMPLNAWDAANYAGFTNAAWLCQRGSRLCRGVAQCPGNNAAQTKTRRRSRPRGNQQRRTRAARQRSWRSTRVDSSLRQDVGGALGVEGHGAAGRRAASHRRRDRAEARPPGAAPRDRPGGRGSRARSRPRLPQTRSDRRCVRPRSCTASTWPDAGPAPAASGSRWPDRSR